MLIRLIVGMQDYRTAFCINCGGATDTSELTDGLTASAKENIRIVVLDSHRPIHHSFNNEDDQNFVLLHNPQAGDVALDNIPLADAALSERGAAGQATAHRHVHEASCSVWKHCHASLPLHSAQQVQYVQIHQFR